MMMITMREGLLEWLHEEEMKHETRETYYERDWLSLGWRIHEPLRDWDPPSKQNLPSMTPNFLKCCSCQTPTTLGGIAVTTEKDLFWRWSLAGPVDSLLLAGTWVTWTRNCSTEIDDKNEGRKRQENGNQWFKEIMIKTFAYEVSGMSHRHARTSPGSGIDIIRGTSESLF